MDLPGVGEASLLFRTQAGVSQRQTEEPFYSVPRDVFRQRGGDLPEYKSLTSSTRLDSKS